MFNCDNQKTKRKKNGCLFFWQDEFHKQGLTDLRRSCSPAPWPPVFWKAIIYKIPLVHFRHAQGPADSPAPYGRSSTLYSSLLWNSRVKSSLSVQIWTYQKQGRILYIGFKFRNVYERCIFFCIYTVWRIFCFLSLTKQCTADCNCREACGLWDVADFAVLCWRGAFWIGISWVCRFKQFDFCDSTKSCTCNWKQLGSVGMVV